jgi:hypothetical protein
MGKLLARPILELMSKIRKITFNIHEPTKEYDMLVHVPGHAFPAEAMREQEKVHAEAERSSLALKQLFSRLPCLQEVTLNLKIGHTFDTNDRQSPPNIAIYFDEFDLDYILRTLRKVTFVAYCKGSCIDSEDDLCIPLRAFTQFAREKKHGMAKVARKVDVHVRLEYSYGLLGLFGSKETIL